MRPVVDNDLLLLHLAFYRLQTYSARRILWLHSGIVRGDIGKQGIPLGGFIKFNSLIACAWVLLRRNNSAEGTGLRPASAGSPAGTLQTLSLPGVSIGSIYVQRFPAYHWRNRVTSLLFYL
jgi:hypothetical protein